MHVETMEIAILALTFFSASFAVYALAYRPHMAAVRRRADEFLAPAAQQASVAGPPSAPLFQRLVKPVLGSMGAVAYSLTPAGWLKTIQSKLDAAGNPGWLGVKEYLALSLLSPLAIIPLTWWGASALDLSLLAGVAWRLCGIALGVLLPHFVVQKHIDGRQSKIRRSLADVVDLMVVSVDAGIGFDGAMQRVASKLTGPLPEELRRVLEEVRLGKPRSQALKDMARRTQVADLSAFVAAVHQAEVLGASIVQVLHAQAQAVRERRSQRAREAASKLPVKLLFPLVFFIFPALFVVLLGPGVIQMGPLLKLLGGTGR